MMLLLLVVVLLLLLLLVRMVECGVGPLLLTVVVRSR